MIGSYRKSRRPSTGRIRRFARADAGATAIEYAMIACGIAVAIVAAVNQLGAKTNGMFASVSALLN